MENIPMLHYNFMSHVCHVRRTIFSLTLLHRVHSCKTVTTWKPPCPYAYGQTPNASLKKDRKQ
jgi:hypothetical protein